jgi:hypothetical protein
VLHTGHTAEGAGYRHEATTVADAVLARSSAMRSALWPRLSAKHLVVVPGRRSTMESSCCPQCFRTASPRKAPSTGSASHWVCLMTSAPESAGRCFWQLHGATSCSSASASVLAMPPVTSSCTPQRSNIIAAQSKGSAHRKSLDPSRALGQHGSRAAKLRELDCNAARRAAAATQAAIKRRDAMCVTHSALQAAAARCLRSV